MVLCDVAMNLNAMPQVKGFRICLVVQMSTSIS